MKPQALHLPYWSVYVPALFLIAASQLLPFVWAYSGVRGQVQSQSPGPGIPEVEAAGRVEAAGWPSGCSLPGVR